LRYPATSSTFSKTSRPLGAEWWVERSTNGTPLVEP
jgi:hypothetical protein